MELVLIRHAQPAWTETGPGALDPVLTDLGHRQAAALAEWLGREDAFDELLVSTARRAVETAAPVARTLGLVAAAMPELVECGMTNGAGVAVPAGIALPDLPGWEQSYKGERFDQFHHRITTRVTSALAARGVSPDGSPGWWDVAEPGRRVLLVAHGGVNSIVTGQLLGLDPIPQPWDRFLTPHASISRFTARETDRGWVFSLRSFADVAHLAEVGVTI